MKESKAIGFIPVSKAEQKEEIAVIKTNNDDESVLDESANVTLISPMMAQFSDEPTGHGAHRLTDESVLTRSERTRLAMEVNAYRCQQKPSYNPALWLAVV